MLDPMLLMVRTVFHIGVVGIVAGDESGAIALDSVARVGIVRITGALRAVFGDRKARQDGTAGSQIGDPADQRHREHRLRASGFAVRYEGVSLLAGDRALLRI